MSIIVPFNFDPELTAIVDTVTPYTVPAGRYAIATITLSADTAGQLTAGTTAAGATLTSDSTATTLQIYLAEGDALTVAAGSTGGGSVVLGAGIEGISVGVGFATASVGGSQIAEIRSKSVASAIGAGGGATINVDIDAFAFGHVAQYQKQS